LLQILKNIQIKGSASKPILLDAFFNQNQIPKAIVIFSHGFKGFKDWGHFNALGKRFADEGLIFIKFNFSYNGTTVSSPDTFDDLEAFGNNNYSIELNDLELVINWALTCEELKNERDNTKLYLLGHSRGGGISIIKAAENKNVKKLVTWASVSDFLNRNKKKTIDTWKDQGVVYTFNTRTNQKMPLYFQFYEDLQKNAARYNIQHVFKTLQIPILIVHGTNDEAVSFKEAEILQRSAAHPRLLRVEGAGHTFGIKHPFSGDTFPEAAQFVIQNTIQFLKS